MSQNWSCVPRDVLGSILELVDWGTVGRARLVNKWWKEKIDSKEIRQRLFKGWADELTIQQWWSRRTISCVQGDVKEFQLGEVGSVLGSVCLCPIEKERVRVAVNYRAKSSALWSLSVQLWDVESCEVLKTRSLGHELGQLVLAGKTSSHSLPVNVLGTANKVFHLNTAEENRLPSGRLSNICEGHIASFEYDSGMIRIFDLSDLRKKPKCLTPKLDDGVSFLDLVGGTPCILTPSIVLVQSNNNGWWVVISREDGSYLCHVGIQGGIHSLPFGLFANGERVVKYDLKSGLRAVNGCAWADWDNIFVRPGPGTFSFLCQHVGDPNLMLQHRVSLGEVDQFLLDSKGNVLGKLGLVFCYAFDGVRLACDQGDGITIFNLKDGKPEETASYKLQTARSCRSLAFSNSYLVIFLKDGKLIRIPLVLPKSE